FMAFATKDDDNLGDRVTVLATAPNAKPIEFERTERVEDLAFSPDGRQLAGALSLGLSVWDVASAKRAWVVKGQVWDSKSASLAESFSSVHWTTDGANLVAQTRDGPLAVYAGETGRLQGRMGEPIRAPSRIVWSGDDRLVAQSWGHIAVWG